MRDEPGDVEDQECEGDNLHIFWYKHVRHGCIQNDVNTIPPPDDVALRSEAEHENCSREREESAPDLPRPEAANDAQHHESHQDHGRAVEPMTNPLRDDVESLDPLVLMQAGEVCAQHEC